MLSADVGIPPVIGSAPITEAGLGMSAGGSREEKLNSELLGVSPISQLIFFHKAIKAELNAFHRSAVALRRGAGAEAHAFLDRYRFIRAVYKYHSWAEDEVGGLSAVALLCFPPLPVALSV